MADNATTATTTRRLQEDQRQQLANVLASSSALIEPMVLLQATCFRAWADGMEAMAHSFYASRNEQHQRPTL